MEVTVIHATTGRTHSRSRAGGRRGPITGQRLVYESFWRLLLILWNWNSRMPKHRNSSTLLVPVARQLLHDFPAVVCLIYYSAFGGTLFLYFGVGVSFHKILLGACWPLLPHTNTFSPPSSTSSSAQSRASRRIFTHRALYFSTLADC